MTIQYKKIVGGKYEMWINDEFLGFALKSGSSWVAYNNRYQVFSNNRANAAHSLLARVKGIK